MCQIVIQTQDITILAVNADEISNFEDVSGESGIAGEHRDLQLASLQDGMPLSGCQAGSRVKKIGK